ncbi:hypothetical protein QAD02_010805 [Eretmocerus hayati]|uniref:Uncharacterized protein n=1 Tax=Eretmocerus hayati TaxID=131215 RepID=A0ACC2NXK1_9HYME|nr:hypothetical protein QAD02_010805 [Eretmocerus hayati]
MSYRTVSVGITRHGPEGLEAIARPPYIDAFNLIFDERIAGSPSSHSAASVSSYPSPARSEVPSSFCLSSPARSEASIICLETLAGSEAQSVIRRLGSPARSDTESVICLGSPACSDYCSVVCIESPSPLRPGIDTPFSPKNSKSPSESTYTPLSDGSICFLPASYSGSLARSSRSSPIRRRRDGLIDEDVVSWFNQEQPIFPGLDLNFSVPNLLSTFLPSPAAPSQDNNNNLLAAADEEFNQALRNVQEESSVDLDQRYSNPNTSISSSPLPSPPFAPSEGDDNPWAANKLEKKDNDVVTDHDQENAAVQFELQAEVHHRHYQEQNGTTENSTVEVHPGNYADSTNDVSLVRYI